MIYLFIISLLILFIYIYDYKGALENRLECYFLCLIFFILIGGLRYRLGTDTVVYQENFKYAPTLSELFSSRYIAQDDSYGYLLLSSIIKSTCDSFIILQLIQSIFVNCVIFYFIKKYTRHIFIALLLYFFLNYFYFIFEIMREAIAVCFFLIGWNYYIEKKLIPYYFFIIIALTFHISASICLFIPLFSLPFIRNLFKFNKFFWIFCIFLFCIGNYVFSKFFDIINLIEISSIQDASNVYSQSSHYGSGKKNGIFTYVAIILVKILYPYIAFYLVKNKVIKKKPTWLNDRILEGFEMGICIYIYFSIASLFIYILHRFTNYFFIFALVTISEVFFSKFQEKKKRLSLSISFWIIFFIPLVFPTINGYLKYDEKLSIRQIRAYYPYDSILSPNIDNERENYYKLIGKFR